MSDIYWVTWLDKAAPVLWHIDGEDAQTACGLRVPYGAVSIAITKDDPGERRCMKCVADASQATPAATEPRGQERRMSDSELHPTEAQLCGYGDVGRMREILADKSFDKLLMPIREEMQRGDADRFALSELLATLVIPCNREAMRAGRGLGELFQIVDQMNAEFKARHASPAPSPADAGRA